MVVLVLMAVVMLMVILVGFLVNMVVDMVVDIVLDMVVDTKVEGMFQVMSWLSMHNFPHGLVSFADGLSTDPLRWDNLPPPSYVLCFRLYQALFLSTKLSNSLPTKPPSFSSPPLYQDPILILLLLHSGFKPN